jgi:type IV secretory pathway VirB10-like protein
MPATISAEAPVERAEPIPEPAPVPVTSDPVAEPANERQPLVYEIVVPASAVIGLEIENTISSEGAQVEDRVDARVTRDVYADERLAIPAGSRVIGAVTTVERGGKLKDRARLGVRFHTIVLPGGRQLPIRTEAIYREGDSPGAESTRKIGGAAIGGAVLGAILGGGKGAVAGASVGAAGGTAAVMAGGRNAATLTGGSVVTVRLSSPVTVEVER